MKKSLYEILDGAEPKELDLFEKESKVSPLSSEIETSIQEKVYAKTGLKKEKKRARSVWLRMGALAACALFIVGMITVLIDDLEQNQYSVPIVNIQTPSDAPQYYGSQSSIGSSSSGQTEADPAGVSVTARLLEVLPDVYTFYDDWRQDEFRLLRMQTVKLLNGENMTSEFYYLVPVEFMTDFSLFDRFVIMDMAQFGFEYSVMYNKTQGMAEQLSLIPFAYRSYGYTLMGDNMMAFDSKGNFDSRLWNANQAWQTETENSTAMDTLLQAEKKAMSDHPAYVIKVNLIKDVTGETAEIIKQATSFENGLFVTKRSNSSFSAVRYLNGFATNERIDVHPGKWNRSNQDWYKISTAKFEKEDLDALPDLNSAIVAVASMYDKGQITPPHLVNYKEMELRSHGIFGWYAKTEDGVLGIIRVTWQYHELYSFYDDAYYIVEYGSENCMLIDRDALVKRFGQYETTYISDEEYTENGLDIMEVNA